MKSALVTGGAGFIGSALVRRLLAEPEVERVVVLDNLLTGRLDNLPTGGERWEFHRVDIRDRAALKPLFDGIDVVFHQAAVASVPRSISEPELCHEVNVDGTFNVLLAAARSKTRRVVFASSSAIYGDSPASPKREAMTPAPRSPYALHKWIGERYLDSFAEHHGLDAVALRYFNVFGPRQDPRSPYSGVLSIFADRLIERRPPMIHGDGEQTRDFIFVDDVVELNLLAARSERAPGGVYNAGRGRAVSLNEVWRTLVAIEGFDPGVERGPTRQGDVRHSEAAVDRSRDELGFAPRVSLEEGLRRTLAWIRAEKARSVQPVGPDA